jgi:quinol monooxygenase YgiN
VRDSPDPQEEPVIALTATMKAKEGRETEFERVMQGRAEKVLANETGCKLYQLSRSKTDPRTYLLMERYTDEDALRVHSNTGYFKAAVPEMMGCCEGPPAISLYDEV